jgi:ferredoxin/coenzyme F420-reducing hydrogenase delta subunit
LGRLLRGIHRYAADAFMLLTLLHLLREAARGHFRGVRWFSWLTGLPLLWLLWMTGVSGLWLLWDERALFSVTATAEWLQVLPLGADLLARNFLTADALNDRFFSLIMFVHIGLPLLLLALTWAHLQRMTHVRVWPPRALALTSLCMLALLALVWPAVSLGPAETGRVVAQLSLDWFFLWVHPLVDALSAAAVWWLIGGVTLLLALLPLWRLPTAQRKQTAQVDLAHCNGCSRCVADCPFGAVVMVARTDASRHLLQASVNADRCTACGICVGACPSATPFQRIEEMVSGIEMPDAPMAALRRQFRAQIAVLRGPHKVVVFSCRFAADCSALADPHTAVIALECAAMLPPSFLEYATRHGASAAVVAGCRQGDCEFRLGDQWVQQRLAGTREPRLRGAALRERIAVVWCGNDLRRVRASIANLRSPGLSASVWVEPAP